MRFTDDVMARNVYPDAPGASLGTTSTSPSSQGPSVSSAASDAAQAAENGATRGGPAPLAFWAMFLILLLGLFYLAQRLGESSEFSNLKASAYNVLAIGLVAVVAIPPVKLATAKLAQMFPVLTPARDYVLAV